MDHVEAEHGLHARKRAVEIEQHRLQGLIRLIQRAHFSAFLVLRTKGIFYV